MAIITYILLLERLLDCLIVNNLRLPSLSCGWGRMFPGIKSLAPSLLVLLFLFVNDGILPVISILIRSQVIQISLLLEFFNFLDILFESVINPALNPIMTRHHSPPQSLRHVCLIYSVKVIVDFLIDHDLKRWKNLSRYGCVNELKGD